MVRPLHAGWWSAPDPYGDFYRPPLRLAADARRLDMSPAWFSWVGAAPALELLERIGIEGIGTGTTSTSRTASARASN